MRSLCTNQLLEWLATKVQKGKRSPLAEGHAKYQQGNLRILEKNGIFLLLYCYLGVSIFYAILYEPFL